MIDRLFLRDKANKKVADEILKEIMKKMEKKRRRQET